MKMNVLRLFWVVIVPGLLLSACSLGMLQPAATSPASDAPTATAGMLVSTPQPEPSHTAALPRTLTVCLGQEPNSLYPFGNLNSAARSVLGAIYDGPIDTFTNGYQPVILEKIPSIENGEAELAAVTVKRGDMVVDAKGNYAVLDFGLEVLPSGCNQDACVVKYTGSPDFQMDQLIVTFRLLPGLTWSDGAPLTAADSVFAFNLASDPATPGSKYLIDRTSSYEALDDQTVQWWGLPGFMDATYSSNYWAPLPRHIWENVPASELASGDLAAHPPLGWGA